MFHLHHYVHHSYFLQLSQTKISNIFKDMRGGITCTVMCTFVYKRMFVSIQARKQACTSLVCVCVCFGLFTLELLQIVSAIAVLGDKATW